MTRFELIVLMLRMPHQSSVNDSVTLDGKAYKRLRVHAHKHTATRINFVLYIISFHQIHTLTCVLIGKVIRSVYRISRLSHIIAQNERKKKNVERPFTRSKKIIHILFVRSKLLFNYEL